ncbi:MAG: hypothetical protein KFBDDELM_00051 [Candidatus Argoarchaeum ethanivorans]|uniref:UDP-glucose/GDP-mannose dehydrogenase N-terminal domain-containing protein n=1 Tax=Candidatus Argoarchaeum ethanivorans TaxID=2608793 RepID=A0A811T089_9EURY|nr:MAG: hypothetical protein KFBDDELM_00051 [Candidatus Argoarchaeum ethanivorans]CAD6491618.1 MAG: hypothetical protein FFODKBPE_00169 [Candidatus Argoarchaeum ethanivorans]
MNHKLNDKTVCVAGLGYVGLPLALAFSGHLKTIGFNVDAGKIGSSPGRTITQASPSQTIRERSGTPTSS